jgi:hypothetical protein
LWAVVVVAGVLVAAPGELLVVLELLLLPHAATPRAAIATHGMSARRLAADDGMGHSLLLGAGGVLARGQLGPVGYWLASGYGPHAGG